MNRWTREKWEQDAVFSLNWAAVAVFVLSALIFAFVYLAMPSWAGPMHRPNPRIAGLATVLAVAVRLLFGVTARLYRIPIYWLTGVAAIAIAVSS